MLNNREIYAMNLPHRAVSVYMYLRDRADKDGRCYPSVRTIASDLSISPRTVQRAVRDLEKAGMVRCEERVRVNGGRSSTIYNLSTN